MGRLKFKYKFIIAVILVLASLAYLIYGFFYWQKLTADRIAACQYLDNNRYGKDISLVDCFGIFSIEHTTSWEDNRSLSYYIIRDDKHANGFAMIENLKQYKIVGDYMYVYEKLIGKPEGYTRLKYGKDEPWKYPRQYYIRGEVKEIYYNSPLEFPHYLKVEMTTGEVTLYNTYVQMPEEAKNIFKELEQ